MKDKWAQIAGQWKQFAGEAKKKWGDLSMEELSEVDGDRKVLADLIQTRYSIPKKEADKQIQTWANTLKV